MKNIFQTLMGGKTLGLHFADDVVRALKLSGTDKKPRIDTFIERDLPVGVVSNGEILQPDRLIGEVTGMFNSLKKGAYKAKRCVIPIPESQVYEQVFYFSKSLKRKQLIKEIKERVMDTFPLAQDQIKFDYEISQCGDIYVVFVVAVAKKIFEDYMTVANSLENVKKIVLEPEYLSLLRNLPMKLSRKEGNILVYVNQKRINYFTIWDEIIFDSNLITRPYVGSNYENFIEDLLRSVSQFNTLTDRAVSQVLISAKQDEVGEMIKIIERYLQIPVALIDNYRFCPQCEQSDDAFNYKVVTGSALKGIGTPLKIDISFSK